MNLGLWKQCPSLWGMSENRSEPLCRGLASMQSSLETKTEVSREREMKQNDFLICWISGTQVLTQTGSDLADLIMAQTESRGLNYRAVLISTIPDLRSEEVLGKRRKKKNLLGFVVTFYIQKICLNS